MPWLFARHHAFEGAGFLYLGFCLSFCEIWSGGDRQLSYSATSFVPQKTTRAFCLHSKSSLCCVLQSSEHLRNPPLKIIPDVHPHSGAWISTASSPAVAGYRTCRPCSFPR